MKQVIGRKTEIHRTYSALYEILSAPIFHTIIAAARLSLKALLPVLIYTLQKVFCRQGSLKLSEISAMVDLLTNHAFWHVAYHGQI